MPLFVEEQCGCVAIGSGFQPSNCLLLSPCPFLLVQGIAVYSSSRWYLLATEEKLSHDNCPWSISSPAWWEHCYSIRRAPFYSCELLFDGCMNTQSPLMSLSWHNPEVLAVPSAIRCSIYLPVSARSLNISEPTRSLDALTLTHFLLTTPHCSWYVHEVTYTVLCLLRSIARLPFVLSSTVANSWLPPASVTIRVCGPVKTMDLAWSVFCPSACFNL